MATGPHLPSITQNDPSLTNADAVSYTVTFSEPVDGVDASQFTVIENGVTGGSIASVTPVAGSNGTQYTVAVNTGTGSGSLALGFTGVDVRDLAGNPVPGGNFVPVSSTLGIAGYYAISADLNGDGKLDLVTETGPNSIAVLLGNGDGTFQPAVNYTVGSNPNGINGISIGDVNSDGNLDIVVSSYTGAGSISVLLGDGHGGFSSNIASSTGSSYPRSPVIADVNGDGIPDILVANDANRGGVSVLLGNNTGSFTPSVVLPSDGDPVSIAVADINGDGIPDVVFSNVAWGANDVQVYLGTGGGNFVAAPSVRTSDYSAFVVLQDINGDGKPDLVYTTYDGRVAAALGNGDGTFQTPVSYQVGTPNYGLGPGNVVVADVNGDGKPDLVYSNRGQNSVSVLLGNGDGTFQNPQSTPSGDTSLVAVGDFTGDGRPDIAVSNSSGTTTILENVPQTIDGPTYTIDKTPPTVSLVATNPTTGDEGIGQSVQITLTFSESVTVAGTGPSLALNDGGTATYVSGSGTNTLTFNYTVAGTDTNVSSLAITAVNNGASATDGAGNAANFSGAVTTFNGLQITTTDTWINGAQGDWTAGSNWVSGYAPGAKNNVVIGPGITNISTTVSAYNLTVNPGANPLQSGANIYDLGALSLSGQLLVNGGGLELNGVTLSAAQGIDIEGGVVYGAGTLSGNVVDNATAPGTGIYAQGSMLVQGDVSGAGNVETAGNLTLELGGSFSDVLDLDYLGWGNAVLKIDHPSEFTGQLSFGAVSDSIDLVGTKVQSATITGGTVSSGSTVRQGGELTVLTTGGATLTYNLGTTPNALVKSVSDNNGGTLIEFYNQPVVTQATASPSTGDEGIGRNIAISLTFSAPVDVSGSGPSLTLNDGGTAAYVSGSGTNTLTFAYTVAGTDGSTPSLAITGVTNGGASVTDAAGNAADFTAATTSFAGLQIDTLVPVVGGVNVSPSSGDLNTGAVITLSLSLNKPVTVTGATPPTLTLNDGGVATYVSGSGTSTLVFKTTVANGQNTPALAITGSNLNGSTITDLAGNQANLAGAIGALPNLAIGATVSSVTTTVNSLPADPTQTFGPGAKIVFTVTTSEAVSISGGTPFLTLNDGGKATYTSGSGTKSLTFTYTVGRHRIGPEYSIARRNRLQREWRNRIRTRATKPTPPIYPASRCSPQGHRWTPRRLRWCRLPPIPRMAISMRATRFC